MSNDLYKSMDIKMDAVEQDDDLEEGEIVDDDDHHHHNLSSPPPLKIEGPIPPQKHRLKNHARSSSPSYIYEALSRLKGNCSSMSSRFSTSSSSFELWKKRWTTTSNSVPITKLDRKERAKGKVVIYDDAGRRKAMIESDTSLKKRKILKPHSQLKRNRSSSSESTSCSSKCSDGCCSFCSCTSTTEYSDESYSKPYSKDNHKSKIVPIQRKETRSEKKSKSAHSSRSKTRRKLKSSSKEAKDKRVPSSSVSHKGKEQGSASIKLMSPNTTTASPKTNVHLRYRLEELRDDVNSSHKISEKENLPQNSLPGNAKPLPGSLGEMLLKRKMESKGPNHDKPHQETSLPTSKNVNKDVTKDLKSHDVKTMSPPLVVLSDDEDELTLRLLALQSTGKAVGQASKLKKEDPSLKPEWEMNKQNSFSKTKFPSVEEMRQKFENFRYSLALKRSSEKSVELFVEDNDLDGIRYDPTEDLDLMLLNDSLTHNSDVTVRGDPVDMEISSNNSECEEELIINHESCNSTSNQPISEANLGNVFDSNNDSQFPVEWAYMMPPPPPPDEPDNNLSSINKWCYDQNMFAQAIESSYKDAKQIQRCPNQLHLDQLGNGSAKSSQSDCGESLTTVPKERMCSCLNNGQVNTENLNAAHAEHYKAFMTKLLLRSNSMPEKDPSASEVKNDDCQHCKSLKMKSQHSSEETSTSYTLVDEKFATGAPSGKEKAEPKSESCTEPQKSCLDDEDEDLLLAQLLIDQAERDSAKKSLKSANRASSASPTHSSKKIPIHSLPRSTLVQEQKKKDSSKTWSSNMTLDGVRNNRLENLGSTLNRDSFPYGYESTHLRFPPVKPVIIPVSNDSDSDDDFNLSPTLPKSPTILRGIDELLKNARNASMPSTAAKSLERSQSPGKLPETAATPKALQLLSKSKQQRYRKLKEEIIIKNKQLEQQKLNKLKKNSPIVSSDCDSDHSQPSFENKVAAAQDKCHTNNLEVRESQNEVESSSLSPLCGTLDDEDETALRNLLLKSLTRKQQKDFPDLPNRKEPSGRQEQPPPTLSAISSIPSEALLTSATVTRTSPNKLEQTQKGTKNSQTNLNLAFPQKVISNITDKNPSQSSVSSLNKAKNNRKVPLTPSPHTHTLHIQNLKGSQPKVDSFNVTLKDLKIFKKIKDELFEHRMASCSISNDLAAAVSETEKEVEEYTSIMNQISQLKSKISLLNKELQEKTPKIQKNVECIYDFQIKLSESKIRTKHWEAIVEEFGKKTIDPSYAISDDKDHEPEFSDASLKEKVATLLKSTKMLLLKKKSPVKEVVSVISKRTPRKAIPKTPKLKITAPSYTPPRSTNFKSTNTQFTAKNSKGPFSSKGSLITTQHGRIEKSFKVDNRIKNRALHLAKKKVEVAPHIVRQVQKQVAAPKPLPQKNMEVSATKARVASSSLSKQADEAKELPKMKMIQARSPPSDMGILCPYDLLGRCNDDLCIYHHLSNAHSRIKTLPVKSPSSLPKPSPNKSHKVNRDSLPKETFAPCKSPLDNEREKMSPLCNESDAVTSSTVPFERLTDVEKGHSERDGTLSLSKGADELSSSPAEGEKSSLKSQGIYSQSVSKRGSIDDDLDCSSDPPFEIAHKNYCELSNKTDLLKDPPKDCLPSSHKGSEKDERCSNADPKSLVTSDKESGSAKTGICSPPSLSELEVHGLPKLSSISLSSQDDVQIKLSNSITEKLQISHTSVVDKQLIGSPISSNEILPKPTISLTSPQSKNSKPCDSSKLDDDNIDTYIEKDTIPQVDGGSIYSKKSNQNIATTCPRNILSNVEMHDGAINVNTHNFKECLGIEVSTDANLDVQSSGEIKLKVRESRTEIKHSLEKQTREQLDVREDLSVQIGYRSTSLKRKLSDDASDISHVEVQVDDVQHLDKKGKLIKKDDENHSTFDQDSIREPKMEICEELRCELHPLETEGTKLLQINLKYEAPLQSNNGMALKVESQNDEASAIENNALKIKVESSNPEANVASISEPKTRNNNGSAKTIKNEKDEASGLNDILQSHLVRDIKQEKEDASDFGSMDASLSCPTSKQIMKDYDDVLTKDKNDSDSFSSTETVLFDDVFHSQMSGQQAISSICEVLLERLSPGTIKKHTCPKSSTPPAMRKFWNLRVKKPRESSKGDHSPSQGTQRVAKYPTRRKNKY